MQTLKMHIIMKDVWFRLWEACKEDVIDDILYRCAIRVKKLSAKTRTFVVYTTNIAMLIDPNIAVDTQTPTKEARAVQIMMFLHLYIAKQLALRILRLKRRPPTYSKLRKALLKASVFSKISDEIVDAMNTTINYATSLVNTTKVCTRVNKEVGLAIYRS